MPRFRYTSCAFADNTAELRRKQTVLNEKVSICCDLRVDRGQAIDRKARLSPPRKAETATRGYFQSRTFTPRSSRIENRLPPRCPFLPYANSRPSSSPPLPFPGAMQTAPRLQSRPVLGAAYESFARKITKFPSSRLKSSRRFYHIFPFPPSPSLPSPLSSPRPPSVLDFVSWSRSANRVFATPRRRDRGNYSAARWRHWPGLAP